MAGLDTIYGPEFFRALGRRNETYMSSARIVAAALFETLAPQSVADLGCGNGVFSHLLAERGVRVLSIDGVRPPPEDSYPVPMEVRDLSIPFDNTWGLYDLTLCLEVAEHIPESRCDVFLDNLALFGSRIALSAAPPDQGGHHHVNEQPKRYWARKLAERGFVYDRRTTGRLVERLKTDRPPLMWMGQHISLYQRPPEGRPIRRDLPFGLRVTPPRRDPGSASRGGGRSA